MLCIATCLPYSRPGYGNRSTETLMATDVETWGWCVETPVHIHQKPYAACGMMCYTSVANPFQERKNKHMASLCIKICQRGTCTHTGYIITLRMLMHTVHTRKEVCPSPRHYDHNLTSCKTRRLGTAAARARTGRSAGAAPSSAWRRAFSALRARRAGRRQDEA